MMLLNNKENTTCGMGDCLTVTRKNTLNGICNRCHIKILRLFSQTLIQRLGQNPEVISPQFLVHLHSRGVNGESVSELISNNTRNFPTYSDIPIKANNVSEWFKKQMGIEVSLRNLEKSMNKRGDPSGKIKATLLKTRRTKSMSYYRTESKRSTSSLEKSQDERQAKRQKTFQSPKIPLNRLTPNEKGGYSRIVVTKSSQDIEYQKYIDRELATQEEISDELEKGRIDMNASIELVNNKKRFLQEIKTIMEGMNSLSLISFVRNVVESGNEEFDKNNIDSLKISVQDITSCTSCRMTVCRQITNLTNGLCFTCANKWYGEEVKIRNKSDGEKKTSNVTHNHRDHSVNAFSVRRRPFSQTIEIPMKNGGKIVATPFPYLPPDKDTTVSHNSRKNKTENFIMPFGTYRGHSFYDINIRYLVNLAGYTIVNDDPDQHSIRKLPPVSFIDRRDDNIKSLAFQYIKSLCWTCGGEIRSAKNYTMKRNLHVEHMNRGDKVRYKNLHTDNDYKSRMDILTEMCSTPIPSEFIIEDCDHQDDDYSYTCYNADGKRINGESYVEKLVDVFIEENK